MFFLVKLSKDIPFGMIYLINSWFLLIASELVENLDDLSFEYTYITKDFYIPVNPNCKNEILEYEDGPMDDKDILNEDEYNKERGKVKKIKY